MKSSDIDILKSVIREEIDIAVRDRFTPVLSKLDAIQKVCDLIKTDMDNDRKDFAEIKTSQSTVERISRELLDMFVSNNNKLVKKIDQKVEETMLSSAQAVADSVQPIMATMVQKVKNGVPLENKKPWWRLW